jgi:multisubunit Na+/H+ antiporter MnhB subunit
MEKKPTTAIIAGIILALVSIVLFLVYYFTGLAFQDNATKWIPALIMIAFIIIFIVKWANDNNNNVTFGQCFGYGFKMIAMTTIIVFVFTLIFLYTFPDYKTQLMDMMRNQFNQKGNLSDEQKEQALGIFDKFFMISILGGSLFGNLVIGTIASLIGAGVAKKNPVNPFDRQPI